MNAHKLLKKVLIGVASLALICPLAMSGLNNTNVNARRRHVRTHRVYHHHKKAKVHSHRHRSYALSYNLAKRVVRKAYNHKNADDDVFSLHDNGRYGRTTNLKAQFGAKGIIYFAVRRSGKYAHIHASIYTSDAGWVRSWYYRTYKIRRNATARI